MEFAGRPLGADTEEVLASLGVSEGPPPSCSGEDAESEASRANAESEAPEDGAESGDDGESCDGAASEAESGSDVTSDPGSPQAQTETQAQTRKG